MCVRARVPVCVRARVRTPNSRCMSGWLNRHVYLRSCCLQTAGSVADGFEPALKEVIQRKLILSITKTKAYS